MYSFNLTRSLAVLCCLLLAASAFGQEDTADTAPAVAPEKARGKEIVISATKSEINKRETGASVTIITEKDIERRGKETVIDTLRDVPGLTVIQESPFGGKASVFVRGGKSGNVLVLVDGVEANDPSNPDRSYDFANLTTDNVERIEILRGPQSTLYGSDATGGVINIITRKGSGKPRVSVKAEAGAYHTFKESVHVAGGNDDAFYSFAVARTDSKGFSQASRPKGAPETEKDGYANTVLSSRMGLRALEHTWVNFALRYSDAKADIDDGAYLDDPNNTLYTKNLTAMAAMDQPILPWWRHKLSISYTDIARKQRDKVDGSTPENINSWFQGAQKKAEWQHNVMVGEFDEITAGIAYKEESMSLLDYSDFGFGPSQSEMDEKLVGTRGYYLQNHLKLLDAFFTTAGVRVDDHETFGTKTTYQVNAAFIIPVTGTRLKGQYGTGFKAPSLYQLYAPTYGNADLKPEESRSYEFGLEQPVADERIVIEAVYFDTRYTNMFGYDSFFKTINIGRVDTHGIEATLMIKICDSLQLDGVYTYTKAEDRTADKQLLRRPAHQASANINWMFVAGGNINLGAAYVGKRNDAWYDASIPPFGGTRNVRTDEYLKLDLFASYDLTEYLQLFGKIENLTDETYEQVVGYRTAGRSFYGGARGTF